VARNNPLFFYPKEAVDTQIGIPGHRAEQSEHCFAIISIMTTLQVDAMKPIEWIKEE
jgi:hypothetical protein